MAMVGRIFKNLWFWASLVLLGGSALGIFWFGYNPWQKPLSPELLRPLGVESVQEVLLRRVKPQKLVLDAPTKQLIQQLEDSRFKPLNPRAKGQAIVLMYHDAVLARDDKSVWFDTTPAEFESEIKFLRDNGANFVTLDQLRHHLTQNAPLPKNPVALTFDDNYVGFYQLIYPILQREQIPAALFVHTNYVGVQDDRPKNDWETLRKLDREGLITIGSHTLSHPEDMSKLSPEIQRKELLESKWILERELGHPMLYISYPNGKADVVTWKIAREVGYAMGFMEDWQLAGDTPDMLAVSRYIQIQLRRAWRDLNPLEDTRSGLVERRLKPSPIRLEYKAGLALIRGGRAVGRLSPRREDVSDFMAQAGAVAGINGTFFADPLLKSNDNTIVGPVMAQPYEGYIPERNPYVLYRIVDRPLVAWNSTRIAFVPFKLDMNQLSTVHNFMPDFTDEFVGGAWIVHKGRAVWPLKNPPTDHSDWRPRVFFGYSDGDVVLGASLRPISTVMLSRMAAAAGIEEAVLLDSGYSSSLIYQNRRIVVGRHWDGAPSRPVPHAIVLLGRLEQPVAQRGN